MNSEPAFPFPTCASDGSCGQYAHGGMSLRDYFAGKALSGVVAAGDTRTYKHGPESLEDWRARCAFEDATYCYRMADAMLEAREATP